MNDLLDSDGYPTEETLRMIAEWPWGDYKGLIEFVSGIWEYSDCGYGWQEIGKEDMFYGLLLGQEKEHTYTVSTAGWSGNESIVCALQDNYLFWGMCWFASRRGGHYCFVMPDNAWKGDKLVKPGEWVQPM